MNHDNPGLIALSWTVMLVAAATLALITAALVFPYEAFSYGEPGPIKVTERTSTGIPVVRKGDPIIWDQPFCNRGKTTYTARWADIYGDASEVGFATTPRTDLDDRIASFEVPSVIFYADQDTCATTEVFAILPDYVPAGTYYRFRIESTYAANPIRDITEESVTEMFLLLPPGAPVP